MFDLIYFRKLTLEWFKMQRKQTNKQKKPKTKQKKLYLNFTCKMTNNFAKDNFSYRLPTGICFNQKIKNTNIFQKLTGTMFFQRVYS